MAYDQIDVNAQQIGASPKSAFDKLVRDVTIKEPGYAYIYVSNENPTQVDVYFDDLTITHTKTNVVQYSEYYPFGLQTSNSWTRENTTGNQFLYNQGTEANATTGWYDLFFRNYDPTLGRFAQVDPLASQYHNQTTYQYANNDPVYWSDPSGAAGDESYSTLERRAQQGARTPTVADFFNGRNDIAGMFGHSWNISTYGSAGGVGSSVFGGEGTLGHDYSSPTPASMWQDHLNAALGNNTVTFYGSSSSFEVWEHGKDYQGPNDSESVFHHEYYYLKAVDQQQNNGGGPGDPIKWFGTWEDISSPDYPGVKIYQTSLVVDNTGVTIPGIGILISQTIRPRKGMTQMLQHEYGHFLDYKFSPDINNSFNPTVPNVPWVNYMLMIGIPSAFDLMRGSDYKEHHDFYTEQRADQWAEIWFGSKYQGK